MYKNMKSIIILIYTFFLNVKQYITGSIITKPFFQDLSKKRIYLLGTPEHDNIGDHAIALAELGFLDKFSTGYSIIEVSVERFYLYLSNIKKYTTREDTFIMTGGGNMGNIYIPDENVRRIIIKKFPQNRIIIMPQTVYFTDDRKGQSDLKKASKLYSNRSNITLYVRENISFSFCKSNFKDCTIKLCPDMVFSFDKIESRDTRKGIALCIRDDIESSLNCQEKEYIKNLLISKYKDFSCLNTCYKRCVPAQDREKIFNEKLDEFMKYTLVITDRLHGMIFSAITKTPCIVLNNFNYKIKSSYQWIKDLNYVKLVDNINELDNSIECLLSIKRNEFSSMSLFNYYDELRQYLAGCL